MTRVARFALLLLSCSGCMASAQEPAKTHWGKSETLPLATGAVVNVSPTLAMPSLEPLEQVAPQPGPPAKRASAVPTWTPPTEEEKLGRPERQWRWIVEAGDDGCRERLANTEAHFRPLEDRASPNVYGCGIPRGVALLRGPTGVKYNPAVRVDCSFALRLGEIETLLHEEAQARFGAKVARIGTLGSYACRKVNGRLRGMSGGISEHSFGNALDVTHFELDDGRRISVLRDYPRDRAPATRDGGLFLRRLVSRVWHETGMRALGPDFDRSHLGHLHFDAGSRWWRR